MTLGNRAHQRFLHEIVCPVGAARQCPSIPPKPWNLALDEPMKFRHFVPPQRTFIELMSTI
jgi:hypothetical protein